MLAMLKSYAIIEKQSVNICSYLGGVSMKSLISRRFHRYFGLKKFIVVTIRKGSGKRNQFVSLSRNAEIAIARVSQNLEVQQYDIKAYTESQFAHMLKLRA